MAAIDWKRRHVLFSGRIEPIHHVILLVCSLFEPLFSADDPVWGPRANCGLLRGAVDASSRHWMELFDSHLGMGPRDLSRIHGWSRMLDNGLACWLPIRRRLLSLGRSRMESRWIPHSGGSNDDCCQQLSYLLSRSSDLSTNKQSSFVGSSKTHPCSLGSSFSIRGCLSGLLHLARGASYH